MAKETGGGEQFIQVIKNEIIPFIDKKYPSSVYRAISGHSLGGLFVLSILAQHPTLFEDYLVMDPSLWYDEGNYSKYLLEKINQHDLTNKSLFIAIANTLGVDHLDDAVNSNSPFAEHQKNISVFCKTLNQRNLSKLHFSYNYYTKDDHGSVPFIGIYDGLRKIFEPYQLSYYQVSNPLFDPEIEISKHFENLSSKIKTPIKISIEDLNLFDIFYQINQDQDGRQKLRNFYKKLYPSEFEALSQQ